MQAAPPVVPAPPTAPAPVRVVVTSAVSGPEAVYRAFNEQRKELNRQLDQLVGKRSEVADELSRAGGNKVVQSGAELRIADLDKRISDVEKELAVADQQVAKAASVPGAIVEHPPAPRDGPPEEVYIISALFIVVTFLPLSFAFARRIWRRSAAAVTSFPKELVDRLDRLDQSMDSIAIEVERIGEGQRFVTRVLTDNGRVLGVGAAQPIDVGVRGEKAKVLRESERG